jgi:very-short-patch-repair endonuclease
LLDIADEVTFTQLRRALAEAEYQKLVTLEEVEAALGRGKPGSARLRAAFECHRPQLARTKSVLEEKFILLCERHSLTPPDVNVEVAGYEVDAVWFEAKLAVELDGRTAHSTPRAIERDHQRDMDLRAAGYTVLRYTWQQITQRAEQVAAELRRALRL